jgi:hypothetical protein
VFNSSQFPLVVSLCAIVAGGLAGCASKPPARQQTPEQEAASRALMETVRARVEEIKANGPNYYYQQRTAASQPVPAPIQTAPVISEQDLAKKFDALPRLTKAVDIAGSLDGFSVNGARYLDPEGDIVDFSGDSSTGDVTYMIRTGDGRYVVKFLRVGTDTNPIVIANSGRQARGVGVQTATGQNLNGESVILTSNGFLVTRKTAVFQYTPGKAIRSYPIPEGFHVARFQNGAIGRTGYVLVERDIQANNAGFVGELKSLGSMVGVGKKEDYALMRLDNGKLTLINVSIEDNQVNKLSDCRRQKGRVVNKCANMDSYASLYEANGHKNRGHYFWRIAWFGVVEGPILIALEDGLRSLTITNLQTGKKVEAFHRGLGITSFDAYQDPAGAIRLAANIAGSQERIDDVAVFLATKPAMAKDAK